MTYDIELEIGIAKKAMIDTGHFVEMSSESTRVDLLTAPPLEGGYLETAPGKIKATAWLPSQEVSVDHVTIKTRQRIAFMVDVASRPGCVRSGVGAEFPVIATGGPFVLERTPYIRISHNGYYDRSAALLAETAAIFAVAELWPALAGGVGTQLIPESSW